MEKRLSDSAEALYAVANFHSISGGYQGFIPDSLLADLEEAEPVLIDELVEAGRWEAAEGGYHIVNPLLVEWLTRHINARSGSMRSRRAGLSP